MAIKRDKGILLNLTEEQHSLLVKAALAKDSTLSAWLRKVATQAANNLLN
ncbi:hypothetical protein GTQ43_30335 [Nostoc sp. KVJ3]|nr:hypothetical protein [Nostoc sp. KVJ3]MCW5317912.1 hypothetical protein [Nostoc sp. KVJ3]